MLRSGFTLIELMIILAIIAVIVVIVTPSLLHSRIAANETSAIASCKAFAEAEETYRRTDYNRDGILEYSSRLSGNDSLLERTSGSGDLALIDTVFGAAEGVIPQAQPKAGYVFTVLQSQGSEATGGTRNYMAGSHMLFGYGLSAIPAAYLGTGRHTLIINNGAVVFQGDRGSTNTGHETIFNPLSSVFSPAD